MGEAARYLGITNDSSYGNIGRACKGKRKTAFGYKWTSILHTSTKSVISHQI